MHKLLTFTLTLTLTVVGCSGDDSSSSDGSTTAASASASSTSTTAGTTAATTAESTSSAVVPPAAPTDLKASILEGGVHLTWKDVADNEDNYILENKTDGGEFAKVIELPFDSVTYHDANVTAATNYTYRVKAVNAGGEGLSAEVMITVP